MRQDVRTHLLAFAVIVACVALGLAAAAVAVAIGVSGLLVAVLGVVVTFGAAYAAGHAHLSLLDV